MKAFLDDRCSTHPAEDGDLVMQCAVIPVANMTSIANGDKNARIIVIGAGGHAKEVIELARACRRQVIAMDDDPAKLGSAVLGAHVMAIDESNDSGAVVAIGDNAQRKERSETLRFCWEAIVHPAAWVAPSARLGRGTVVFAGAVIQSDAVLGDHVIVNSGATISHDCVVGDYAHIAPGANLAGGVQIGEGAFIGIGAAIIQLIRIGAWTTVGAGAVIIGDLPHNVVAVGVPARILPRRLPNDIES
jgi:sugar O-acyltransferase (sialic acid O-acetyltransferase NeuD family)